MPRRIAPGRDGRPPLVALLVPNFRSGGVQISMLRKASRLQALGFAIELVVFERKGPLLGLCGCKEKLSVVELAARSPLVGRALVALADPRGIAANLRPVILASPPPHRLAFLPALTDYLRSRQPDALISAGSGPNMLAVWARTLAGVKTQVLVSQRDTMTNSLEERGRWRKRYLAPALRRTYGLADAIVAVSVGVAEELAREFGVPRERVSVVCNPVVTPDFYERAAASLDHPWFGPDEPPVILSVGRLAPQKDFPTLIKAFAQLRAVRPARLLILGDAKTGAETERQKCRLMALAEEHGVAQDVSIPGLAVDPLRFMSRAAVFVLPSRHEGFGNVLVEALACGCPVVSTDCPHGPAEILDGGRYGRLVPVGDSEAMAEAMLATLRNQPDRELLKRRGAEFSVERAVDRYLDLLFPELAARGMVDEALPTLQSAA